MLNNSSTEKLRLMVCPHDTAHKPERWFLFALYLSHNCEKNFHFSPALDFKEFHAKLTLADIIYANPQDSLRLALEHGYIPLARPANLFDEIVFIASAQSSANHLVDITGKSSASVVPMLPTAIALQYLEKLQALPCRIENRDSWMAVVGAVIRQEVEIGFVYRDFYNSLNPSSKQTIKVLGVTEEQQIQHLFLVSPKVSTRDQKQIQDCLLSMANTEKGANLLASLNMTHLSLLEADTLERFAHLRGVTDKLYGKCDRC